MIRTRHPLAINGTHHVSVRVRDMERSLAFYRDILGFAEKTSFLLDGHRFAMLETDNNVYIELVGMKELRCSRLGKRSVWHLSLRTEHLAKSLEAAINGVFEVTVPIRPLHLWNDVTKVGPRARGLFRGPLDGRLVELLEN